MRAVWFIRKFELDLNCTKHPNYSPKSRTPQQPQNVSGQLWQQHNNKTINKIKNRQLEQNDFQELINHSHNMAENLLVKQDGEFYPFGAEIDNQGKLTHVGHYDGDEFPLSQTKIDELKEFFEQEITEEKIRAYAISYDCLAKKDDNSEKTDAIAIECYSKENEQRVIYYFPYRRLTNNELEFGEAWGIIPKKTNNE